MNSPLSRRFWPLSEGAFYLLVVSFFLSLGSDSSYQLYAKALYGTVLISALLLFFRSEIKLPSLRSLPLLFFLGLVLFEVVRSVGVAGRIVTGGVTESLTLLRFRYGWLPLKWLFGFGLFALSAALFYERARTERLLWLLSACGLFLALSSVLSSFGAWDKFFHPLFYSHEWLEKFLFGSSGHQNYTGDVMALGFFPALGLFFYSLQSVKERLQGGMGRRLTMTFLLLSLVAVLVIPLGAVLFLSRGTMISFAAALVVFLLLLLAKYPSRAVLFFGGGLLAAIVAFLVWSGIFERAWREVETARGELGPVKGASVAVNVEGAKRALAIYGDHKVWGVGTGGYSSVSEFYATPESQTNRWFAPAKFDALCHYLQVLAEEGIGAYFYFLFLLAYFIQAAWELIRTKSRFQFAAGLSLFAGVLMVLVHASVGFLMEQITISTLVYILMGASLGALRPDFEHG